MYATFFTKPDIAQTISMVSRYIHDLDKVHWQVTRWIMQYITGIVDVRLNFKKSDRVDLSIFRYVDSDYVGDLDKRRSVMGYIFTIARV